MYTHIHIYTCITHTHIVIVIVIVIVTVTVTVTVTVIYIYIYKYMFVFTRALAVLLHSAAEECQQSCGAASPDPPHFLPPLYTSRQHTNAYLDRCIPSVFCANAFWLPAMCKGDLPSFSLLWQKQSFDFQ